MILKLCQPSLGAVGTGAEVGKTLKHEKFYFFYGQRQQDTMYLYILPYRKENGEKTRRVALYHLSPSAFLAGDRNDG